MSKQVATPIVNQPQPGTFAAIVQVIERAAINPKIDIEKMERLLALQERIMDRQAEQEYAAAMANAQARMPIIAKNKTNDQTKSRYADLAAINIQIKPIYSDCGFSLSFDTGVSTLDHHVLIICEVLHTSGHAKTFNYDAPIDDVGIKGSTNKTQTHARGSSISYGQRYLTKLIFNLTIDGEDDDGNAAGAEPVLNELQIKRLESLAARCSVKAQARFTEMYSDLRAVPARLYDELVASLEATIGPDSNTYPEERFNEMLPQWKVMVESGQKTPDRIVAMVSSKQKLTDSQRDKILALKTKDAA